MEADGVGPEFAVEVVAAVTATVHEHVVAAAAMSFIFAGAASEHVVVVATLQAVVAGAADKAIVAPTAEQPIVAPIADQPIVAAAAMQPITTGAAFQLVVTALAMEPITPAVPNQLIVGRATGSRSHVTAGSPAVLGHGSSPKKVTRPTLRTAPPLQRLPTVRDEDPPSDSQRRVLLIINTKSKITDFKT